jgi:hypothetical protein
MAPSNITSSYLSPLRLKGLPSTSSLKNSSCLWCCSAMTSRKHNLEKAELGLRSDVGTNSIAVVE